MRPLRLTLEGFTCYKQRQPIVDFSELTLFCITGPTGVGKSSLLDAMIFALYGRVPRVGKAVSELISLGADRLSVLFDFEIAEKQYRLTRVVRRGRGSQAQLAELVSGLERSLAGGVQQVDASVERILGLGYEAFTRAVVLPQGEFAHFLKSPPREQREILRDLLRLSVYERMRKDASERLRELKSGRQALERRLHEDFAGVDEAVLESLAVELRSAGEALANAQARAEILDVDKARLSEACRWAGELEKERQRLAELDSRAASHAAMAARVSRARQVVPLMSQLGRLDEMQGRLEEAKRQAERTEETKQIQEEAFEQARGRLDRAQAEEKKLSVLRRNLKDIDEVRGLLEPRRRLVERLNAVVHRQEELTKTLDKDAAELQSTKGELQEQATTLASLRSAIDEIGYKPELDELVEVVYESAVRLTAMRAEYQASSDACEQLGVHKQDVGAKLEQARSDAKRVRRRWRQAQERRNTARAVLDRARQQDVMSHLRSELAPGESCPICEQVVGELPKPIQGSLLDTLVTQFEAREEDRRSAQSLHQEHQQSVNELQAARRRATQELKRQLSRLAGHTRRLDSAEKQLTVQCTELAIERAPLEKGVVDFVDNHRRRRAEFELRAKSSAELENHCQALGLRRDSLEQTVRRGRESMRELSDEIAVTRREIDDYDTRISAVQAGEDLKTKRDLVADQIDSIASGLREAQTVHGVTQANLQTTQRSWEGQLVVCERLSAEMREAREELSDSLDSASFASADSARESVLTPEELEALESEVDLYRRKRHAANERVCELEPLLEREAVHGDPANALEDVNAEWSGQTERAEAAIRQQAELETKIVSGTTRLEKSKRLHSELEGIIASHGIMHRLASDLRSENFQAYLLEQTFSDLVRGASRRLGRITTRYTLEYRDGAFHVFDHDHASELRSADTLSGGETFLVSLVLALELSEQLQNASGAVRVDSLFIDEGFGTLDPETLELVASALEGQQLEGRTVGIITHLTSLTERLPGVIRVERHGVGSRVRQDEEITYNALEATT